MRETKRTLDSDVMRKRTGFAGACLAAAFIFSGCNEQATVADPGVATGTSVEAQNKARQAEFTQQVLKLKAEIKDRALLEKMTLEIVKKFGLPTPTPTPEERALSASAAKEAYARFGNDNTPENPGPSPLLKAASAVTLVKDYSLWFPFNNGPGGVTPIESVQLRKGTYMRVIANALGSADPFVVLFVKETSGYGNIRILDYDDDGAGGLSSYSAYYRPSDDAGPDPVTVYYIVFSANALGGVGFVNLNIYNNGSTNNMNNVPVGGYGAVSNNAGVSPCSEPTGWVQVEDGNAVFAMNAATRRGVWSRQGGIGAPWIPSMEASGNPNFVIGYVDYASGSKEIVSLNHWEICD